MKPWCEEIAWWKAEARSRQASWKEPETEHEQMKTGSDRDQIFGASLDQRRPKTWLLKNCCNNWQDHVDLKGWIAKISWNSYLPRDIYLTHVNSSNSLKATVDKTDQVCLGANTRGGRGTLERTAYKGWRYFNVEEPITVSVDASSTGLEPYCCKRQLLLLMAPEVWQLDCRTIPK